MREHLGFLKVSSVVVKVTAWIFLFLGVVGGVSIIFDKLPGQPRWMGLVIIAGYAFLFFFFYLIAKIADLLIRIISAIGGSASGGNEIKKE
jgi:hypothetical protein